MNIRFSIFFIIIFLFSFQWACTVDDSPSGGKNQPPAAPTILAPANNSTNVTTYPVLSWSCTDPEHDTLSYDVYFGKDNPPVTKVSSGQRTTSLRRGGLSLDTLYYWQVVAKDNHTNSTTGPVWEFTPTDTSSAVELDPHQGGLKGLIHGVTYTVVFDPYAGSSTLSPNNYGEVTYGDLGVDIYGDLASNIVVDIDLPDHLLDADGASMPIEFPSSGPGGGVRAETGGFFNPNATSTFNLGSVGICKLRLGYRLTAPGNIINLGQELIFVGKIISHAHYAGDTTNIITDSSSIVIDVASNAVDVKPVNGGVKGIQPKISYIVTYNPYLNKSTLAPNTHGETISGDVGVNISGDNSANVVVELHLPKTLVGNKGGSLSISFPFQGVNSSVRLETGGYFNPNVTNTFNFGPAGACNLRFGYTFNAPDIESDTYTGQISCVAYYTGLSKRQIIQQSSATIILTIKK